MRWLILAALAVVAVLTAVAGLALGRGPTHVALAPSSPARGSQPPPGITAPNFTLPNYHGRQVSMATLRGRVVVTTLVDTACHESCPLIIARIARSLRSLKPPTRRQIVALATSVHPAVDSSAHARRFLAQRGALGQIDYLVGSVAALRPVWKAYGVLAAIGSGNADVHSADVAFSTATESGSQRCTSAST